MLLRDVLASFESDHPHGIRGTTHAYLLACIQCFDAFLKRKATTADFERDKVNAYIDWMVANRASATVRTQRCGLLMLWRHAAGCDLTDWPKRIRTPRKVETVITTWTKLEVEHLRDYCLSLVGKMPNGVDRGVYFGSLVAAGYETGFRLSDQLSIERDWIMPQGSEGFLTIIESKTGKQCRRILTSETMRMIDLSMLQSPNRRLIWPLWARREQFFESFRKIVQASGIRTGTYKYLRRTAATNVESRSRGLGQEFLNHSSGQVTRESYLDQSQTHPEPLRVSPLAEYLRSPGTRTAKTAAKKKTG